MGFIESKILIVLLQINFENRFYEKIMPLFGKYFC